MNQIEIADFLPWRAIAIYDEHARTAFYVPDGLKKLMGAAVKPIPDQLNFGNTHCKQGYDQNEETAAYRALPQVDVEARDKHEGNRDRQALIREVCTEEGARQRKENDETQAENNPSGRMEFQDSVPRRVDRGGHGHGKQ